MNPTTGGTMKYVFWILTLVPLTAFSQVPSVPLAPQLRSENQVPVVLGKTPQRLFIADATPTLSTDEADFVRVLQQERGVRKVTPMVINDQAFTTDALIVSVNNKDYTFKGTVIKTDGDLAHVISWIGATLDKRAALHITYDTATGGMVGSLNVGGSGFQLFRRRHGSALMVVQRDVSFGNDQPPPTTSTTQRPPQ